MPLSNFAIVRVSSLAGGQTITAATGNGSTAAGTAKFTMRPGEYKIDVEAAGYNSATERASVGIEITQTVFVFLTPLGGSAGNVAPIGAIITPDVQRELDKSLAAIRKNDFNVARKHLEKAHRMLPSSPDVLYLMGMLEYTAKDIPAAEKRFQEAVAAYPKHERSLVMLGQIQLDNKENKEALVTLENAVLADSVNWRAHYLLALAYARTGEYSKAELEAARAGELSKERAPAMMLLKGKLLLLEGNRQEAEKVIRTYIADFPNQPGIADAKSYLERMELADKAAEAEAKVAAESRIAERESALASARPWAPPNVDAAVPPTAPNVACSLDEVLSKAQRKILGQLGDLEKFGASEQVEHQTIDMKGVSSLPVSQQFDYLIFVHHTSNLPYYFDEVRNGAESLYSFPTSLATRGLVSLGFMVIHPVFSKDFEFSCEGLGTWNNQPAWQIHFVQRSGVPARIRSWTYKKVVYPVPLKGRIWVGANNFNLLHLDSSLREPVDGLPVNLEQMSVDYGPVHFSSITSELWLPWHAEMYFEFLGKRYHHKHALTNYVLFDVDTKNRIKEPPKLLEPNQE